MHCSPCCVPSFHHLVYTATPPLPPTHPGAVNGQSTTTAPPPMTLARALCCLHGASFAVASLVCATKRCVDIDMFVCIVFLLCCGLRYVLFEFACVLCVYVQNVCVCVCMAFVILPWMYVATQVHQTIRTVNQSERTTTVNESENTCQVTMRTTLTTTQPPPHSISHRHKQTYKHTQVTPVYTLNTAFTRL